MKTLHTSNYIRNADNPKAVAISEPSIVPVSYVGARDATLAPTMELLTAYHAEHIDHDTYAARYRELLAERGLTPTSIVEAAEDGAIFICFDYEDGDPSVCHRFILAEILNASGLAVVTEI